VNPLLTPEADDMVTERDRTHWIDTNVMLEVYSHGDLYMKWGLTQCTKPPGLNTEADPEARRVRIQGAMWMAMALCHLRAVSLTYQHENQRNILRLAPLDSEVGGWTSTILYVLGDGGVFRGWDRLMTASGEGLSDRDRDRLIVRVCAPNPIVAPIPSITPERERLMAEALATLRVHTPGPLVLVTRDARLIREATAVGVDAIDPEAFGARAMTREAARVMFEARLDQAISRYIARGPLGEWLLRIRAMDRVRKLHAAIWTPPEQPWFPRPIA
jgi:hypothetical protein